MIKRYYEEIHLTPAEMKRFIMDGLERENMIPIPREILKGIEILPPPVHGDGWKITYERHLIAEKREVK